MAASNPQRFLTDNGGSDDRALALKMFWGLVIEAFRATTVFWDNTGNIISYKNITEGKSWQFPVIGDDPDPEYHTPGTELLGQAVNLTEGTVTIDDILVSHYDVPIDQITLSHFDIIAPFARKLGRSLATKCDKHLLYTGLKAARHYAVTGIHSGGNRVAAGTIGDIATAYPATSDGAAAFRASAAYLAQLMDEDNVPEINRFLFITPYIRRVLGLGTDIFDRDYNRTLPNDLNMRRIGLLEGFHVFGTNQMPSTHLTTGPAKYQGDFRYNGGTTDGVDTSTLSEGWSDSIYNDGRPAALALCGASEGEAAIGFVQAGGIYPYIGPDERRNTKFMKAQIMCGAGVMSPWCAGEIYCAD